MFRLRIFFCLFVCCIFNSYAYDRFSLELADKTKLKLSSKCITRDEIDLERNNKPCTVTIEAFQKGIKIAQYSYKSYTNGALYFGSTYHDALKNVKDIFTVIVEGESCGSFIEERYLLWNGKEIQLLISAGGTPDGNYSAGDQVLFSSDPNFSDIVTVVSYQGNEDNAGNGYTTYKVTLFQWNGYKLVEMPTDIGGQ